MQKRNKFSYKSKKDPEIFLFSHGGGKNAQKGEKGLVEPQRNICAVKIAFFLLKNTFKRHLN